MWCAHCKKDFESDDNRCPDCGGEPEELLLVATAASEMEAEILKSKLEAAGIFVFPRHRESGDFLKIYMGSTPFGIDLYVPSSSVREAQELLAITEIADEEIAEEDREATEKTVGDDQNRMLLVVGGVLVMFIILIFALIKTVGR